MDCLPSLTPIWSNGKTISFFKSELSILLSKRTYSKNDLLEASSSKSFLLIDNKAMMISYCFILLSIYKFSAFSILDTLCSVVSRLFTMSNSLGNSSTLKQESLKLLLHMHVTNFCRFVHFWLKIGKVFRPISLISFCNSSTKSLRNSLTLNFSLICTSYFGLLPKSVYFCFMKTLENLNAFFNVMSSEYASKMQSIIGLRSRSSTSLSMISPNIFEYLSGIVYRTFLWFWILLLNFSYFEM